MIRGIIKLSVCKTAGATVRGLQPSLNNLPLIGCEKKNNNSSSDVTANCNTMNFNNEKSFQDKIFVFYVFF